MKIAVAGTGYVGLSLAVLLAQHNEVIAVDVIKEKVDKINNKISPIQDDYIEKYLKEKELNLVATLDGESAYKEAEMVIIAAPTNYDSKLNFFDTKYVEQVIELDVKSPVFTELNSLGPLTENLFVGVFISIIIETLPFNFVSLLKVKVIIIHR